MKILNPVTQVALDNGKVEVRQLPFLKAIEFLKQIAALSAKLFDSGGRFRLVGSTSPRPSPPGEGAADAKPAITIDTGAMVDVIGTSGELTEFILLNTTGKDRVWLESLSLAEGMTVLKAALEQNLSKEVLELGNDIAGVLKALRKPATTGRRA